MENIKILEIKIKNNIQYFSFFFNELNTFNSKLLRVKKINNITNNKNIIIWNNLGKHRFKKGNYHGRINPKKENFFIFNCNDILEIDNGNKEKIYISKNNSVFNGLKTIFDICITKDINNKKNKVFLWSIYSNNEITKIWNFRKKNLLDTYSLERGALPDSLIIDNSDWLINSLYYNKLFWNIKLNKDQLLKVKKYINDFINNKDSLEFQKNENINKIKINNFKIIISIFLQLDNDIIIKKGIGWLKSNENFKNYIKELSNNNKNILFLVKNHPLSNGKITLTKKFTFTSNNCLIVDNYHYKDILKISNKILVINSSVGLQSMMFNKECGILGKSFYNFDDINTQLNDKNDVEKFINSDCKKINFELVEKFIYYLKFKFYVDCKLFKNDVNENTTNKVIVKIKKTHIDNRKKIVIFSDLDLYKNNKNGAVSRIQNLIKILECKYEIIFFKFRNDYKIAGEKINKLNPNYLIVEYVKHFNILKFINKKIKTIVDTHDIIKLRIDSFKSKNVQLKNLNCNNELENLKKFDLILTIQDEEEKYLNNNNIINTLTISHINFNFNNYKLKIKKELKNIFFYGSKCTHNIFSMENFIENCWIKHNLYKDYNLNIYGNITSYIDNFKYKKYNVVFKGIIQNLENIYENNDLLINPALIGSGLKIKNIEALSFGCPIITTKIGAQGLSIFCEEDCLIVSDNYSEYDKILKRLKSEKVREKIQKNIIKKFKENFNLEKNYSQLFHKLDKM